MGVRGARRFSRELKLSVVERYAAGESPGSLAEEFGIRPTLVHQWVSVWRCEGPGGLRPIGRPSPRARAEALLPEPVCGSPASGDVAAAPEVALAAAQRRIAALEHKVGQQQLEVDFFKQALRHFETPRQPSRKAGETASTPPSGRRRRRKAD